MMEPDSPPAEPLSGETAVEDDAGDDRTEEAMTAPSEQDIAAASCGEADEGGGPPSHGWKSPI